jgi:Zn finger protein HypA/HybF involved in hydrogenase expression
MLNKICQQCKKEFQAKTIKFKFCIECIKKHRREYVRNYEKLYPARAKQWQENADKEYRAKNKDGKIKARNISRQIKEKRSCEICGLEQNIQKHHSDYSKPLQVKFLCKKCHYIIHKLKKQKGGE